MSASTIQLMAFASIPLGILAGFFFLAWLACVSHISAMEREIARLRRLEVVA